MIDHSFAFYGLAFLGIILARYFVLAGAIDLLLSVTFGQPTIDNCASTTADRSKVLPAYRDPPQERLFCRETSPEIRRDITL